MLSNTRNTIATAWHLGIHPEHGEESETTVGRYLGRMQWWRPFIGYDYHYKRVGPNGEEIMKGIMGRNILGNDSYITSNADIFTIDNLNACVTAFVDNPDTSDRDFDAKSKDQFANATNEAKEVFAHFIWLWALSTTDMRS